MGLLRLLNHVFGSASGRGKARTGKDRLDAMEASYLSWLKRHNPGRWSEIMDRKVQGYQPTNPLAEYIKMKKDLRSAGLEGNGNSGSTLDNLVDKLPETAEKLAPALAMFMNRNAPVHAAASYTAPEEEPPRRRRALPRPAPEREVSPAAETEPESPIETDEASAPGPEGAPSPVAFLLTPELAAQIARINLEGKHPRDGALWILNQDHKAVRDMVEIIRKTPDERLFDVLETEARNSGEAAMISLMQWFRAKGQWTLDVARYLRQARPKGAKPTAKAARL